MDGPIHPPSMLFNKRHTFYLRGYDTPHSGSSRRRWRRNAAADLFWVTWWMFIALVALAALVVVRGDIPGCAVNAVSLLDL